MDGRRHALDFPFLSFGEIHFGGARFIKPFATHLGFLLTSQPFLPPLTLDFSAFLLTLCVTFLATFPIAVVEILLSEYQGSLHDDCACGRCY